jgi:hypothetical protein
MPTKNTQFYCIYQPWRKTKGFGARTLPPHYSCFTRMMPKEELVKSDDGCSFP